MKRNKFLILGASAILMLVVVVMFQNIVIADSISYTTTSLDKNATDLYNLVRSPNYTDPGMTLITEMRANGMNDSEISKKMEEQGMFFNPETGDRGIGTKVNIQTPLTYPMQTNTFSAIKPNNFMGGNESDVVYKTSNQMYTNVYGYMVAGSLAVGNGKTYQHVITTHIGSADGSANWVEVGIFRNTNLFIYTYSESDNGQPYNTHLPVDTTTPIKYQVFVGSYDSSRQAYPYYIYVNNNWVRTYYMNYNTFTVDDANEAWTNVAGSWTSDTSNAQIYGTWLQYSILGVQHLDPWDNYVDDYHYWAPYYNCPIISSRVLQGSPATWTFYSRFG